MKLRVFAAAGCARAQAYIEKPNPAEYFAVESHVRTRANPPDGDPPA